MTAIFDIETDDRQSVLSKSEYTSFAKPDVARILSISTLNAKTGKIHFYTDKDEKQLLLKFKKKIEEFVDVEAWNGEKFEIKIVEERMKFHKIPFTWDRFYFKDSMRIH